MRRDQAHLELPQFFLGSDVGDVGEVRATDSLLDQPQPVVQVGVFLHKLVPEEPPSVQSVIQREMKLLNWDFAFMYPVKINLTFWMFFVSTTFAILTICVSTHKKKQNSSSNLDFQVVIFLKNTQYEKKQWRYLKTCRGGPIPFCKLPCTQIYFNKKYYTSSFIWPINTKQK